MIYCKNCLLPNTRPNLTLDERGYCNAAGCAQPLHKRAIDWEKRENDFSQLVKTVRNLNHDYDCLIPVSGGKDSTWQVITALDYGLKPLCVTWKTPARNDLGNKNLNNLISLGVNHIDVTINPRVERLFTWKTFERFGSTVIPMHMALHAIPMQYALKFKIPMILWGENSAYEYGGNEELMGLELTHEWLKKFGVTNNTTSRDWVDKDLSARDLNPYDWPNQDELNAASLRAVFLGHFFEWDPEKTYEIAKRHGFTSGLKPKTGYYNFADVDDEFLITIHHWMKWYKFGFTRMYDNLSIEIRRGRMKRSEALYQIQEQGNEMPTTEIEKFCDYVSVTKKQFFETAEKHRNPEIWKKNSSGHWELNGFLFENWDWSA